MTTTELDSPEFLHPDPFLSFLASIYQYDQQRNFFPRVEVDVRCILPHFLLDPKG